MLTCGHLLVIFLVLAIVEHSFSESLQDSKSGFNSSDYRLPKNICKPSAYDVDIEIPSNFKTAAHKFSGKVDITFKCRKSSRQDIWLLNSKNLKFNKNKSHYQYSTTYNRRRSKIISITSSEKYEQVTLKYRPVRVPYRKVRVQSYKVTLVYSGVIGNSSFVSGIIRKDYKTRNGQTRHFISTANYPTRSRSIFPCWDDHPAGVRLSIRHHKDLHVISSSSHNPPKVKLNKMMKRTTYDYQGINPRHISFKVSDFNSTEAQTSPKGTKIRLWTTEDNMKNLRFALGVFKKAVVYSKTYKGKEIIGDLLQVLDLAVPPESYGFSVENRQVRISYDPEKFLIDDKTATPTTRFYVAFRAVQRSFYMWFGNYVSESWNDPWLTHGIATYLAHIGLGNYDSTIDTNQAFVYETLQLGLREDSQSDTHPLSRNVSKPEDINQAYYSSIQFNKGASIMRMVHELVGPDVLKSALQSYTEPNKYTLANEDRLWKNIDNALGRHTSTKIVRKFRDRTNRAMSHITNFKTYMKGWIHQKGYPVINVSLMKRRGKRIYKAVQSMFMSDLDAAYPKYQSQSRSSKWNIPLWYILSSDPKKQDWKWTTPRNKYAEIFASSNDHWIKVNAGQKGFYRVNYEEENWVSLIHEMKRLNKVFSPEDRFGLIDDAFALADAKQLKMSIPLNLTTYLDKEDDFAPFKVAVDRLEAIGEKLLHTPTHLEYTKYIKALVKPVYGRRGWKNTGNLLERRQREEVVRVLGYHGDDTIKTKCKNLSLAWTVYNRRIEPHLREHVLVTTIKHGGEQEWKFLMHKYKDVATEPRDREIILKALAATQDDKLLNKLLNHMLPSNDTSNQIEKEDIPTALDAVSKHALGQASALTFFVDNFKELYKRTGKMDSLIGFMKRYSTMEAYCKVKRLFRKNSIILESMDPSHQTMKAIEHNMNWAKNFEQDVLDFLTRENAERKNLDMEV